MIRQLTSVLFFFLFIGVATSAAQGMTEPSLVVHLYPDGQHADRGIVEGGVAVTLGPREANQTDTTEFYWERDGSLNAVSDSARVVIYLPDTRIRNGQMILICPGGGYNELMFRSEGTYAARLLTCKGYSVGIVCYRMPTGHAEIPLTDVPCPAYPCMLTAERPRNPDVPRFIRDFFAFIRGRADVHRPQEEIGK